MRAQIANWKGIVLADLQIKGTTILYGTNAQGKTSILEAVGCAAVGPSLSSEFKNSRVRLGTKSAKVKLEQNGSSVSLSLPTGARDLDGWDLKVSRVAAWLDDPASMTAKEFNKLLQTCLKTEPTIKDLTEALSPYDYTKQEIDQVWKFITSNDASGWAKAHESYKTMGSKLKGQWSETTGDKGNYGKTKAADWYPANWEQDLAQASEEQLTQQVAFEQTQTEAMIRDNAVSDQQYSEWKETFLGLDSHRLELKEALELAKAQEKVTADAQTAYNATPVPESLKEPAKQVCAYCEKTNLSVGGKWIKAEEHKGPSQKEVAEAAKKRSEAHAVFMAEKAKYDVLVTDARKCEIAIKAAEEAGVKVSHSVLASGADDTKLEQQREHAARAARRLKAFQVWSRALEIHKSIERNQVLITALSDDGLRRDKLAKAVTEFNERFLKPVCELAGWSLVTVHDDLTVTQDSTAYEPSSKAERLCMRISLTVALAMADKSQLIIIDDTDDLKNERRGQLFALLEALTVPVLVGMAVHKKEEGPDFEEAGLGLSYWVQDGSVVSLAKALA